MNLTWEFQICVSSLSLVDFLTTLHPPHQYSVPVRCIFGDFANIKLSSESHWERQQIWILIGSSKFILCFITYGFWQLCTPPTNVKSRSDSDLVTLPILNFSRISLETSSNMDPPWFFEFVVSSYVFVDNLEPPRQQIWSPSPMHICWVSEYEIIIRKSLELLTNMNQTWYLQFFATSYVEFGNFATPNKIWSPSFIHICWVCQC